MACVMQDLEESGGEVRWVGLVVFAVVTAGFLGYLAARDLLGPRITVIGVVTQSWVDENLYLELRVDNEKFLAYMVRFAFGGTDPQWLALEGHRLRLTVHDVSLAPPLTPSLWRIDDLMILD